MILATKPIMIVIDTDNKRPIMTMGKKKGTDIAAIPNLSDTNKTPKIIHMSQITEKYRGIHLYLAFPVTDNRSQES
jgi:hypothetical protein